MTRMRQLGLVIVFMGVGQGLQATPGQVPAGPPYDASIHPNPIVTFVEDADFSNVPYSEAVDRAEIELLGLSGAEGTRENVSITDPFVEEIRILGDDIDVLFPPVVRQTFRLSDDKPFILYSFRDPRPTGIPTGYLAAILNEHAFRQTDNPEESRFGGANGPERLEIRGSAALLFDETETRDRLVLFWQDDKASHVAVAPVSRDSMFRLVRDLL